MRTPLCKALAGVGLLATVIANGAYAATTPDTSPAAAPAKRFTVKRLQTLHRNVQRWRLPESRCAPRHVGQGPAHDARLPEDHHPAGH